MSSTENTKLCDFTSHNNDDFICTPITASATSASSYEIKPALLNLVMKDQFSGAGDDAALHLKNFVALCDMQKYQELDGNIVKLKLFPFSLRGGAKIWFQSWPRNSIDSWDKCKDAFIGKYYPPAKIIQLRSTIMNFKQLDNEHVAQAWERMKSLVKNCPTHCLSTWMVIQTFYAGLNFTSRNLLDSAAGGTFMSTTLGAATKLLDEMMTNYSQWHTERAPTGRKVNSVEEISSLNEKVDLIMSLLSKQSPVDPSDVPLNSLIAQEQVDVNFVSRNNFNNNAYRSNFGSNPRPFPSNSYGNNNAYPSTKNSTTELETMLRDFISTQKAFNKSVEEKLNKLDDLSSKVDNLSHEVELLKIKTSPLEERKVTPMNAIQVQINENIRMLAKLKERWAREEEERIKSLPTHHTVATIKVVEDTQTLSTQRAPGPIGPINGDAMNIETTEQVSLKDTTTTLLESSDLDFDNCTLTEVIDFLHKMSRDPRTSTLNLAFTEHITNALIKAREEKLKLEASIPRKLEDGWDPTIKIKLNNFSCYALCDVGASTSVMPKRIYDMLKLKPYDPCSFGIRFVDSSIKKPLGRIDDVLIIVNDNYVPVDFTIMDIECEPSCPIILGRPFLRTVGAIIDMKEGNIRFQFPLKKEMEHFPRKNIKWPFESFTRASYFLEKT